MTRTQERALTTLWRIALAIALIVIVCRLAQEPT
jgi:hypothetical protein